MPHNTYIRNLYGKSLLVRRDFSDLILTSISRHGVEFYEMHDSTLHAKTFTVDGMYSSIGSFNFDLWSGRGNLETNIGIFDPDTAAVLDKQFSEDIVHRCKPVSLTVSSAGAFMWINFYLAIAKAAVFDQIIT